MELSRGHGWLPVPWCGRYIRAPRMPRQRYAVAMPGSPFREGGDMAESRTAARRDLSGTVATPAEQPTRAEAGAAIAPLPLAQAVAELVGTFALIYVGVMVLVVGAPSLFQNGTKDLVAVALAHGLTIAVMVSATMQISGGQLNPAVTVALAAARKVPLTQAGINIVAQIVGGALGAWSAKA